MTKAVIEEILAWNAVVEILKVRFRCLREMRAEMIQRVEGRGPEVVEQGSLHISLRAGEWEGYIDEGGCSGTMNGTAYSVKSGSRISGGWCRREVTVGEKTSVSRFKLGKDLVQLPFSCLELLQYIEQTEPFLAGRARIGSCAQGTFFLVARKRKDKMSRMPDCFSRTYEIHYFAENDGFMVLEQYFDNNGDPMAEVEYKRLEQGKIREDR